MDDMQVFTFASLQKGLSVGLYLNILSLAFKTIDVFSGDLTIALLLLTCII